MTDTKLIQTRLIQQVHTAAMRCITSSINEAALPEKKLLLGEATQLNGLITFLTLSDFAKRTAEFDNVESDLSKSVALVEEKLRVLEEAVESAKTAVEIATIADQIAQIAAGIAARVA